MTSRASIHPAEQSKLHDIETRMAGARVKTWEAVEAIAAMIEPGMKESDAIKIAQKKLVEMGSRKFWHKCHVRFGAGTTKSFNDPYDDEVLRVDDIFFIDIGPVWDGIEGDAGTSFVVGANDIMKKCQWDAKAVFDAVKGHWQQSGVSGKALYDFAAAEAKERGWVLAPSYVRGHRLSEFPHSFHSSLHVDELDFCPSPSRWVLEIHICEPKMAFGAFHEDLL